MVNQNTREFTLTVENRTRQARVYPPPCRNNKSPEALISQSFQACRGKKKNHADCIKSYVVMCGITRILQ